MSLDIFTVDGDGPEKMPPMRMVAQAKHGLSIPVYEMTPARCKWEWDHRSPNRNFSQVNARKIGKGLEEANKDGRVLLFYEPMLRGDDGHMCDGSHRCYGGMTTGLSFWVPWIDGVPAGAYRMINQGRPRVPRDTLTTRGIANANDVAALCDLLYQNTNGFSALLKNETLEFAEEIYDRDADAISLAVQRTKDTLAPYVPAPMQAFVYYHYSHYAEEIELFFRTLVEVPKRKAIPAARTLRAHLLRTHDKVQPSLPRAAKLMLLIRAVNASLRLQNSSFTKNYCEKFFTLYHSTLKGTPLPLLTTNGRPIPRKRGE